MKEQYKDIAGYEGLYQISNLGNVMSLPKGDGNGNRMRLLKQDSRKEGYKRVTLSRDGNTNRYSVHRLVLEAFTPNTAGLPFVNHIDNDPSNNQVTNLEWCTHSENMLHAQKQGRLFNAQSLAGKAAGANALTKLVPKLTSILGDRFIEVYQVSKERNRRMVKYICVTCSEPVSARVDSPLIVRGGICNSCSRKKKI